MRIPLPLALGLLLGCTNDYDQFNVGGTTNQGAGPVGGAPSGAGPAGGAPSGAGPAGGAPSGAGPAGGAPSGGMGGDGGNPPLGGFGGLGGMGGNGGAGGNGIVNGIDCGNGDTCDVENGELCCINNNGATSGQCQTNCQGNEAGLACDEPLDCPGEVCCLNDSMGDYTSSQCQAMCFDTLLCTVDGDCDGGACVDATDLPPGILKCE